MNELLVKLNDTLEKYQEETKYLRAENMSLKDHIQKLETAQQSKPWQVNPSFFRTQCPFSPLSSMEIMGCRDVTPYDFPNNLEVMSWGQIKSYCDRGILRQVFHVGDTKSITLKNGKKITMRIIGIRHDQMANGGRASLTWEMVNFMEDRHSMNKTSTNKGGWAKSEMRRYLNEDVFNLLPDEVQEVICPVRKITSVGGGSSEKEVTVDRLFLLSEHERYGRKFYSAGDEGRWYEWYRKEGVSYAKTYPDGDSGWGWERSPRGSSSAHFCSVYGNGDASYYNASASYGVAFGFCM